ncbi:hypothetical protein [Streptomyces sp. NPDC001530]|uniref:hypothetical protein n=1 Tax=Streptomyces sp. NPDC001530 TaxID=3364582 RepID=UPI00367AD88E
MDPTEESKDLHRDQPSMCVLAGTGATSQEIRGLRRQLAPQRVASGDGVQPTAQRSKAFKEYSRVAPPGRVTAAAMPDSQIASQVLHLGKRSGSCQEHRVIWRGPYIKGPSDAPLMVGEKAYLVDK